MKEKNGGQLTPGLLVLLAVRAMMLTVIVLLLAAAVAEPQQAAAADESRMLVPVGQTVGIKLFSRGVMVVGLSEISTQEGSASPARACGLKAGDIITHINQEQVDSIEEVQEILQDSQGKELSIRAVRAGRQVVTKAAAVQCLADGSYKLGAWIRDSMAGIGTVTWYDPSTGEFAALGHGISDVDTGLLIPMESGSVMESTVKSVKKGEKGAPGQLQGSFGLAEDLGTLTANTDSGIFGTMTAGKFDGEAIPVATFSQLKTGKASILANVDGQTVEEFDIEILRVYPNADSNSRGMMIKVTDEKLLERTGGIVQGMSGCPILQEGRLVGAVTHVLVNDAACGYGIFIGAMLETGE